MRGNQVHVLTQGTGTQTEVSGVAISRSGIDRGAAGGTKCQIAAVAAVCGLDVDRWVAGEEAEAPLQRWNNNSESRAPYGLAIIAVAQRHGRRIYSGFERQVTAETGTVDFHRTSPTRLAVSTAF